MSDRVDLVERSQRAGLFVGQRVEHHLNGFFMCRHRRVRDLLLSPRRLIDQSSVDADPLAEPLGQYLLGIRIDDLIFQ